MTGSRRSSSSRSRGALAAAVLTVGLAACVDERAGLEGTQSLAVEILSPTDLGTAEQRLADGNRDVMIRVTAKDAQGQLDATFEVPVDVYTYFLGTLTPERSDSVPDLTVPMVGGVGTASLTLPQAYGPTYLWVEDGRAVDGRDPTFATGTSPTIWYRDPYLDDISRPVDETSLTAFERSPLERKQVRVESSKHPGGHLVVTGVYTQGYTLSDVDASGVADPYSHIFVFTFGRPRAEDGTAIVIGHLVDWVGGGVGEFNGFTELNFPQTALESPDPQEALVPAPVPIDGDWLANQTDMIELEKLESALVVVENGNMCQLDDDYTTYQQWKLAVGVGGDGCGKPINVISAGAAPSFDPTAHVAETINRVVGTLRAVNIGTFHVWIMYPRRDSDITL